MDGGTTFDKPESKDLVYVMLKNYVAYTRAASDLGISRKMETKMIAA